MTAVKRNHLEICVVAAMQSGREAGIIDELMEALRFDRVSTGPGDELPLAPSTV
jgi:hypothetical protein